ncbi:MAG: YihY/virulence factor BrkB family protein [Deltaproteobacteria bacterium]|nr:YihY/virulence factor BrkB family protein [Myxococcales bacterium]MDP3214079.1 YihY/virulence factor BrkB family protein [Deltaproteobacteria bacterium]
MKALLADTVRTFTRNDGRMLAGATAFFALVSVAPMFLIALVLAGALTGEARAQDELLRGVRLWVGGDAARALGSMLDNVHASHSGSEVTALSVVVIAWGATRLFSHLQRALDHLWGVRLRHETVLRRNAMKQARRRLVSFGLVLVCSVGLLASVALRTAIVATGELFGVGARLHWRVFDHVLSFAVVTVLFGLIFRVLPSVHIRWRQAAEGALVTSALFAVGRMAVAAWLGRKSLGSTFGAAGSVVLLMLWTYYSAQIFFLGAAFIAARARHRGEPLLPSDDAVALGELG